MNIFRINRKADEIILDFGRNVPETEDAEVKARVVMTAEGAKALMSLIKDFVEREPPKTFEKRTVPSYVA